MKRSPAILVFEDGTVYEGVSVGQPGETFGEVVFNTSMCGYQEILTDPSYKGQMVTMTYPLIGNYGIAPADAESHRCFLEGFIVRELSETASNFRSRQTLDDFLRNRGIVGISEVDTRAVVRKVRSGNPQRAGISSLESDPEQLRERVLASPRTDGRDLVQEVTRDAPESWTEGTLRSDFHPPSPPLDGSPLKVVAYDFGIKHNILRSLVAAGFDVTVVPAATPAAEVLALEPDGVFLSNGPGDPQPVGYAVDAVREFLGRKVPLFGICLGHQILGLALGGRTRKMPFGHHGGNQPVLDRDRQAIEITAQNHSYVVDEDSLPADIEITHVNLNDQTIEGLRHRTLPVFSVQFHPEAAPGPHDALHLFERFRSLMTESPESARPSP